MKEYLRRRETSRKVSIGAGMTVTVVLHVVVLTIITFNGIKYIWPPAAEQTFVLDFTANVEEIPPVIGKEPVAEKVDKEKPVELVQQSKSPVVDKIPNETQEAAPDPVGDVEVPTPPVDTVKFKPEPRASFPGMGKKPSNATTPHVADEASDSFKEGQSDGNSDKSSVDGEVNAHLEGRKVNGNLDRPAYTVQDSGQIMVKIWVDNYGTVQKAIVESEGTTIDDVTLWQAAINAAKSAHFQQATNITADTPQLQEGTITYKFILK